VCWYRILGQILPNISSRQQFCWSYNAQQQPGLYLNRNMRLILIVCFWCLRFLRNSNTKLPTDFNLSGHGNRAPGNRIKSKGNLDIQSVSNCAVIWQFTCEGYRAHRLYNTLLGVYKSTAGTNLKVQQVRVWTQIFHEDTIWSTAGLSKPIAREGIL
jgi:hypothetical protein